SSDRLLNLVHEQGGREKVGGPARRKASRDKFTVDGLGARERVVRMHVARVAELARTAANERQPIRTAAIKNVRVVQGREQREQRRQTRVARIATARERAAQGRKRNVEHGGKCAPRLVARAANAITAAYLHAMGSRHRRTL